MRCSIRPQVTGPAAPPKDRRHPARTRRPGARGGAPARWPTWAVSPGQERQHLIGRWVGAVKREARQAETTTAGSLLRQGEGGSSGLKHLQGELLQGDRLSCRVNVEHVPWRRRSSRMAKEALVGFQGRGCADVVQRTCYPPFLLDALLLQWPSIRRCASRTMVEHKTPESHKSVQREGRRGTVCHVRTAVSGCVLFW